VGGGRGFVTATALIGTNTCTYFELICYLYRIKFESVDLILDRLHNINHKYYLNIVSDVKATDLIRVFKLINTFTLLYRKLQEYM